MATGGLFVNAEQVAGPTAVLRDAYAAWHERRSKAAGATPDEWAAAQDRMSRDRWATVEQQPSWLRDAGFADVDCLHEDHCFVVLVARRSNRATRERPRQPGHRR